MENYAQGGDLADVIRATTSSGGNMAAEEWKLQGGNSIGSYTVDEFGDPFAHLSDPLLHEINSSSGFHFHNSGSAHVGVEDHRSGNSGKFANDHFDDEMIMKRPTDNSFNIFSRMIQICPSNLKLHVPATAALSSRELIGPPPLLVSNNINNNYLISTNSCNNGVQISSPTNTGIKRRKSQAKKVVCIPAPSPANSRPTSSGEIVPSDLWAWRKYGQKPIKGSPFPRGYYRCSSSKGCLARKQVERSRTDPNMLVITYTSEHNHPWPTQRNALAGSSRSHHTTKNTTTSRNPPSSNARNLSDPKDNQKEKSEVDPHSATVKDEMDNDQFETDGPEFDDGFPETSNPELPEGSNINQPEDSFFADLGDIEPGPLDLLFGQGSNLGGGGEKRGSESFSFD